MNINIIPQDLRQEEMLLQIEETLKNLKAMSDQVFSRIDDRINKYQKDFEDIDRRADSAREKVEQLKSCKNKAIKLYSSPKFPSSEDDDNLYTALCPISVSNERTMRQLQVKSTHVPFDDEVLKEKLQFYQVPKFKPSKTVDPSDGPLGPIPWKRITSISSLVMFNSSENPYYRRSHGSSLMESKLKKKMQGAEETDAFAPAPITVSTEEPVTDLFKYNPDLETAPKIFDFLPEALPDLPGIAVDIFDQDFEADPILPSISKEPLPTVSRRPEAPPEIEPARQPDSVPSSFIPVVVPVVAKEPTARPPPPGPPPPPPPLPPPSPPRDVKAVPVPVASPDAGRASLLDAIRKAGGKPKASGGASKELKIERKLEKKKEVVSTDLMTDLANKLKARRTGISGAQEKPSAASAMDRVASMIPPPPKPNEGPQEPQEDEDSDWE